MARQKKLVQKKTTTNSSIIATFMLALFPGQAFLYYFWQGYEAQATLTRMSAHALHNTIDHYIGIS